MKDIRILLPVCSGCQYKTAPATQTIRERGKNLSGAISFKDFACFGPPGYFEDQFEVNGELAGALVSEHESAHSFLRCFLNNSIDRLARNLFDLQQLVEQLTAKGVTVRFHKERLEFSGKSDPIARLTLQLMGAFAEFERVIINERRIEGIAKARKLGRQIGARSKLSTAQADELRQRVAAGESKMGLSIEYGISRQAVYNYLRQG